jgi:hypothetical protein
LAARANMSQPKAGASYGLGVTNSLTVNGWQALAKKRKRPAGWIGYESADGTIVDVLYGWGMS